MASLFLRTGRNSLILVANLIRQTLLRRLSHGNIYNYRGDNRAKTSITPLFGFIGGIYESTFPCRVCDEGTIPECEACEEGGNSCEECDGEGYCQECGGEGEQACQECEGNTPEGRIICKECDGEGSVSCGECDEGYIVCESCEEGYNECKNCEGDGIIEDTKATCVVCDGEGTTKCSVRGDGECDEGYIVCESCEEGYKECVDCVGEGLTDCEYCVDGQIDCDYCDGGSCEYCDEGWVECGECGGDWEGGECYSCGGAAVYHSVTNPDKKGIHYVKPIASKRKQRMIRFRQLTKSLSNPYSSLLFGDSNSVSFYPARLIDDRWVTHNLANLKTVTYIIYPAIVGGDGNTEYDVIMVPLSESNTSKPIRYVSLRENVIFEGGRFPSSDSPLAGVTFDTFSDLAERYDEHLQYEAAIVVTDIPISENLPFMNYIEYTESGETASPLKEKD